MPRNTRASTTTRFPPISSTTTTAVAGSSGGQGTTMTTTAARRAPSTRRATPANFGDSAALDRLYRRCEAGDMQACDDLYDQTEPGTEYNTFGDTCGGRNEPSTYCTILYPEFAEGPGDDAHLDDLYNRCGAGDWAACDRLYQESPIGSEYERYGATCGNRVDVSVGASNCQQIFA